MLNSVCQICCIPHVHFLKTFFTVSCIIIFDEHFVPLSIRISPAWILPMQAFGFVCCTCSLAASVDVSRSSRLASANYDAC